MNIYRGLFESSAYYDNCIDINELKDNYIVLNSLDCFDDELDNKYDCNEENCVNCYHSDGKHCSLKNIDINKYTPLCWGYRDCFTMQPCSDLQYDENIDDFEDAY